MNSVIGFSLIFVASMKPSTKGKHSGLKIRKLDKLVPQVVPFFTGMIPTVVGIFPERVGLRMPRIFE